MIGITLIGNSELQAKFASLSDSLRVIVLAKSEMLVQKLADKIRDEKLNGQVLNSRSGKLRNSIESDVEESGSMINASVYVAGDVPYAAIQEYGGTTKAHIIEALSAKALAFGWQGKSVFFKRVNHPGSVIPERSYLRSSLEEMQADIVSGMEDALHQAID